MSYLTPIIAARLTDCSCDRAAAVPERQNPPIRQMRPVLERLSLGDGQMDVKWHAADCAKVLAYYGKPDA